MWSILRAVLISCFVLFCSVRSWGATIVSPQENEQVDAGSWITVKVKPDPGEQWQGFALGFKALEYDAVNNVYKISIQVPNDVLGYRDDLRVIGVDMDDREVELTRRVYVKLPPNVVLESIMMFPKYIVLYKLLPDDLPEEKEKYEISKISVNGIYSDGVKRSLTSSEKGTIYTSSNSKVAIVGSEGVVTAQSPGTARIIVQNGKHRAEVTAEVLPVKRYPDGKIKLY